MLSAGSLLWSNSQLLAVVSSYRPPPPSYRLSLTLTSPLSTAAKELVLIPLHAAPNQAVAEIDALYDVYLDVIDKWNTDVGSPSPRPPTPVPDYHKCSPRSKMCLLCLPPGHAVSG